ncbi:hypothetical protein N752_31050 [Desulforamulus aquiferis]|nr:hypothetical protein N752_31050 [Desulforamulus aquiferis]
MSALLMILKAGVLAMLAPLIAGIIKNAKGKMQSRRGPGCLQVYYDLAKFLKKDNVFSPTVSWIFHAAPYVYFATALGAAALVPSFMLEQGIVYDNLFVLIYLLALGDSSWPWPHWMPAVPSAAWVVHGKCLSMSWLSRLCCSHCLPWPLRLMEPDYPRCPMQRLSPACPYQPYWQP